MVLFKLKGTFIIPNEDRPLDVRQRPVISRHDALSPLAVRVADTSVVIGVWCAEGVK